VIVDWVSDSSHSRAGEAWTRKQGSGRLFVGQKVAIKYLDDPAVAPVILSEVAEREWANEFGLFFNPLITVVLTAAMIAGVAWVGAPVGSRESEPST
jgi:hypothetical protein